MRGKEIILKWWREIPKRYRWFGFVSILLLVIILSVIYWYYACYQSTTKTFWSTVENNLATKSVVKSNTQNNGKTSIATYVGLYFNGRPTMQSLRQITDGTTTPASKLSIETIGTELADYQRYSNIERPSLSNQQLDYSEVYKIWLKTSSDSRPPNQLANNIFGPMLFGNFNYTQRNELLELLKKAYQPTFSGQSKIDGKRVYKYSVKVDMLKYAEAVERYIKLTGLRGSNISKSSFQNDAKLALTMKIDVNSRQIVSIDPGEGKGVVEDYSSYGLSKEINKPAKIYTIADLQKAIQSASQ